MAETIRFPIEARARMHVAVVMVGFRNADDVAGALKALEASVYPDFEIHVCENGGPAAYGELVRTLALSPGGDDTATGRLPGGQPVEAHRAPGNLGYAGGINFCLGRVAAFDAIWVLNPDTQPEPEALAALVEHMAAGGYGIVGSRLVSGQTGRVQLYAGRWRRFMARGLNIGFGADRHTTPDVSAVEREMDYVNGASMLVSRAFIEAVGPMRDDYFLYCEEVDWCLRRGTFRLGYAHGSVIDHAHGTTMGSNRDRRQRSRLSVYLDERNRLVLTRRIYPRIYPLVVLSCLLLTAQYLRHGAVANFRHALAGWWAGLRGETGLPPFMRTR